MVADNINTSHHHLHGDPSAQYLTMLRGTIACFNEAANNLRAAIDATPLDNQEIRSAKVLMVKASKDYLEAINVWKSALAKAVIAKPLQGPWPGPASGSAGPAIGDSGPVLPG